MDISRERLAALTRVSELQSTAQQAYFAAVRTGPDGGDLFEDWRARARQWMDAAADYTATWPGDVDLSLIATPFASSLFMRADHLAAAGDRAGAEACRAEANGLIDRYVDAVRAADLRRGQALTHAAEGHFHRALLDLDAARETFLAAGRVLLAAQTALDLANLYAWLGDFERVLEVLRSVRDQTEPWLRHGRPTDSDVLAAVRRQMEDIEHGTPSEQGVEAAALQRIAIELAQTEARTRRRLGTPEDLAAAERIWSEIAADLESLGVGAAMDFELASITLARGDPETAAGQASRRADAFRTGLFRPRLPALLLLYADIALARDDAVGALTFAEAGIADLVAYPDSDLSWKLGWRRAQALVRLDHRRAALDAMRDATAAADELRKAPLGHRLDTTFVRDKVPLFDTAITVAIDVGAAADAALFIERLKSRALAAAISIPAETRPARSPDETAFDEVSARLDALEWAIYSGQGSAEIRRERKRLLADRRTLTERIRIADPRWRTMSEPVPVDLSATLAGLARRGQAALTLFHRPDHVAVAALRDGEIRAGRKTLTAATRETLDAYAANLRRRAPDPHLFDVATDRGLSVDDLVPGDLARWVAGADSVVVVPHGPLHLLPWAGLTLGGRRLFEHTAVAVLPNLSCLERLDAEPVESPRAVLIGPPDYTGLTQYDMLDDSLVREVAAGYGDALAGGPVTGPAADEAAFWRIVTGPPDPGCVLHVYCHGILTADEPLSSGLLLSGSKVDAGEVALRRLRFPEVVLSACSSGWRPGRVGDLELAGDDALGLPAAFLEAGARFLLVSVPLADVAGTHDFMLRWHAHRRSGRPPLQATRATQLDLLAADDQAPWRWIGLTAYGCC